MLEILFALIFLSFGIIFLVWPEKVRDWSLNSPGQNHTSTHGGVRKLMFSRTYILSFRIGGGVSILIGLLLIVAWVTGF